MQTEKRLNTSCFASPSKRYVNRLPTPQYRPIDHCFISVKPLTRFPGCDAGKTSSTLPRIPIGLFNHRFKPGDG